MTVVIVWLVLSDYKMTLPGLIWCLLPGPSQADRLMEGWNKNEVRCWIPKQKKKKKTVLSFSLIFLIFLIVLFLETKEKMNIFNQKRWVFSLTLMQQFKSLFKSLLTEFQAVDFLSAPWVQCRFLIPYTLNNKAQKTSFAILCGYMGVYDRMYWQEVNTNSDY